jgi:hypothetical protein
MVTAESLTTGTATKKEFVFLSTIMRASAPSPQHHAYFGSIAITSDVLCARCTLALTESCISIRRLLYLLTVLIREHTLMKAKIGLT